MSAIAEKLEKLGLEALDRSAWPRSLVELAEVVAAELERQGRIEPGDELPAYCVALAIVEVYQGTAYYMPRCESVANGIRNAAIWQEFDGTNASTLARRWSMTERQMYNVIASERQRRAHNQQDLFKEAAQ